MVGSEKAEFTAGDKSGGNTRRATKTQLDRRELEYVSNMPLKWFVLVEMEARIAISKIAKT